jgi:hypothetical protein
MTELQTFLNSTSGNALVAMLVVAFVDFVTGVFAALRDGTFALDSIAAFLRKHIWGRVAPIALLLVIGYYGGSTVGDLFTAAAVAAGLAYVAETAASVLGNINPPKASDAAAVDPTKAIAETLNPIPKD